jgi:hypothetical protein
MRSVSKPSRRTREWLSDEEYVSDQDKDSTWSEGTVWGDAAANKFVQFGTLLGDRLYHDDRVADFGGNDGWAALNFYMVHKVKPLVVDCEPKRLAHAENIRKLPVYRTFIESMPDLTDKSIDWGFTSHTLEHTRDTAAAILEIARVVKRGCMFIMPLENLRHARNNHAHAICFTKLKDWEDLLKNNGWKMIISDKVGDHEAQIFAEPVC